MYSDIVELRKQVKELQKDIKYLAFIMYELQGYDREYDTTLRMLQDIKYKYD